MSKLTAHGHEIGTIEYLTSAKRYMSDGVVLKNQGFGWKIHGKVKPGVTPQQAFENAKARFEQRISENPLAAQYRSELHSLAPLSKRWKLHTAIQMLPDDPDGVWSEACDGYSDNVHADIDDVVKLCRLFKASCTPTLTEV